jgi:hypothetical protein
MQQIKPFRNVLADALWGRPLCRVRDVTGHGGRERGMGVSSLVPKRLCSKRKVRLDTRDDR